MFSLVVAIASCFFVGSYGQSSMCQTIETPTMNYTFFATSQTSPFNQLPVCLSFGSTTKSFEIDCTGQGMVTLKTFPAQNCPGRTNPSSYNATMNLDAAGLSANLTTELGAPMTVNKITCCQSNMHACSANTCAPAGCFALTFWSQTCNQAKLQGVQPFEKIECMGPMGVRVTPYPDMNTCMMGTNASAAIDISSNSCTQDSATMLYYNTMKCIGTYNVPMTSSPTMSPATMRPTKSPMTTTTMMKTTTTTTTVAPASPASSSVGLSAFYGVFGLLLASIFIH